MTFVNMCEKLVTLQSVAIEQAGESSRNRSNKILVYTNFLRSNQHV